MCAAGRSSQSLEQTSAVRSSQLCGPATTTILTAHQHSKRSNSHPCTPSCLSCRPIFQPVKPLLLASILLLASLALLPAPAAAVKLKFRFEECISYKVSQYEPLSGSFVSMPDIYGISASYDLTITSPAGVKVHETFSQTEGKFHLVPYESGRYRFCLRVSQDRSTSRYMMAREVIWDLHVGHSTEGNTGAGGDSLKETDTQGLWHYVNQVDAQLQQLRATQQYLYWRERRHRSTVDSTSKRVKWYALARSATLVLVSVAQVFAIRRMFSK